MPEMVHFTLQLARGGRTYSSIDAETLTRSLEAPTWGLRGVAFSCEMDLENRDSTV